VDGSESKFIQWELELQASMEKLNRLSIEKALCAKERDNAQSSSDLRGVLESNTVNRTCYNLLIAEQLNTRDSNQFSRSAKRDSNIAFEEDTAFVGKQVPYLRRSCSTINSAALSNTSTIVSKSNISKSLSNSPVNRIASNLENRITKKVEGANISKYVPNRMSRLDRKDRKAQSSWNIITADIDINATSENQERNDCNTNDTLVNNVQLTSSSTTQAANTELLSGSSSSEHHTAESSVVSQHSSQDDATLLQTRSIFNIPQKSASCSANSSPMKVKKLLMSTVSSNSVEDIDGGSIIKKYKSKTASIRELPLLSFFGRTSTLSVIRGKSCSMIDLDNKQNLKISLGNSLLSNIQAVSAERLANVRHKLVNDHPRATTDDKK
jgi:hypothetical protein